MSGPRPLKLLLAAWNPKGTRSKTPTTFDQASAAFAAAWERAVGSEISRRSRPHRYGNGVLTVLTASSAWSDQLNLLAPRIIEALQRACPDAPLRKLRFIVASGRTKLLLDGERRRAQGAVTFQAGTLHPSTAQLSATAGAQDLGASLEQLAALQATLDADRDRAGWKVCRSCQRRFQPDTSRVTQCAICADGTARSAQARVERALMQAPWLSAEAIARAIPQTKPWMYERVRQRLLTRWQLEIEAAERRLRRSVLCAEDRVVAWSYLMLLTGLMQGDIGHAVVAEVLGRDWTHALLSDERTQKEEARRLPREKHKR